MVASACWGQRLPQFPVGGRERDQGRDQQTWTGQGWLATLPLPLPAQGTSWWVFVLKFRPSLAAAKRVTLWGRGPGYSQRGNLVRHWCEHLCFGQGLESISAPGGWLAERERRRGKGNRRITEGRHTLWHPCFLFKMECEQITQWLAGEWVTVTGVGHLHL